mgnify:CR=1 FL=1
MVVWTNGCFDILHRGHIEMLEYARSLGNHLVVGIDMDERIKKSKGDSRPINTFKDRAYVLRALACVDLVVGFDSDEKLTTIIKSLGPDVMVVGSDWKDKKVIGSEHVKEVKFYDRVEGYSTTDIIEKNVAHSQ